MGTSTPDLQGRRSGLITPNPDCQQDSGQTLVARPLNSAENEEGPTEMRDTMGHHKGNDELREDENAQEDARQEVRDTVFGETGGGVDDLGSQDERRHEGSPRD